MCYKIQVSQTAVFTQLVGLMCKLSINHLPKSRMSTLIVKDGKYGSILSLKAIYYAGILDLTFSDYENEPEKSEVIHTSELKNQDGKILNNLLIFELNYELRSCLNLIFGETGICISSILMLRRSTTGFYGIFKLWYYSLN